METVKSILERLLNAVPEDWDKSEGSFVYDVEKPIAMEMLNFYDLLENRKSQLTISTASGTFLEEKLKEFGFYRKQATAASGYATVSGTVGTAIAVGTAVASEKNVYKTTEAATIGSNGSATIPILCTATGADTNAATGEVTRFPVTIAGLVSVINTSPVTGGSDIETDSELRDRFFEYMKKPIIAGNAAYYEKLAAEVDGVGGAQCIPLWNGAGTAKVVITDATRNGASTALITNVQKHIDENRFIGANVTVGTAETVTINVSCTLSLTTGVSSADVYTAITAAIAKYLKQVSFPQKDTYIPYAKILTIIMSQDGVNDCTDLKINSATSNVALTKAKVAVTGVITIG